MLLETGPFRISRNPLYVGMIVLNAGLALVWPSMWALLFVPVGVAGLFWGAILPESAVPDREIRCELRHL